MSDPTGEEKKVEEMKTILYNYTLPHPDPDPAPTRHCPPCSRYGTVSRLYPQGSPRTAPPVRYAYGTDLRLYPHGSPPEL